MTTQIFRNKDIESEFVSRFIKRELRRRWNSKLDDPSGRKKILSRLYHKWDFIVEAKNPIKTNDLFKYIDKDSGYYVISNSNLFDSCTVAGSYLYEHEFSLINSGTVILQNNNSILVIRESDNWRLSIS